MGSINTYTLKQYKECYSDLLERHKLEYEDHNEFTFINTELENFYEGFFDIEQMKISNELTQKLYSKTVFSESLIIELNSSRNDFMDAVKKSNLSSSMIIDFLEQRKQELEKASRTVPEQLIGAERFQFKNNFDKISENDVYHYFKKELVDKKYLTEEKLEDYLVCAFQKNDAPELKFTFEKITTKKAITQVFYNYYNTKAQKPYGKKKIYVELLTNYFNGYEFKNIDSNFSK